MKYSTAQDSGIKLIGTQELKSFFLNAVKSVSSAKTFKGQRKAWVENELSFFGKPTRYSIPADRS